MPRIPWFERKFDFSFSAQLYPEILERLYGTPIQMEELINSLPADLLVARSEKRWTIQENVGHLIDLEPLWYDRITDILSGEEVMRPADLSNRTTYQADHNSRRITDLLAEFRTQRSKLTDRLKNLNAEDYARTAQHPRLDKPMRIVDLCFFVSEHDDLHLTNMRELAVLLEKST